MKFCNIAFLDFSQALWEGPEGVNPFSNILHTALAIKNDNCLKENSRSMLKGVKKQERINDRAWSDLEGRKKKKNEL